MAVYIACQQLFLSAVVCRTLLTGKTILGNDVFQPDISAVCWHQVETVVVSYSTFCDIQNCSGGSRGGMLPTRVTSLGGANRPGWHHPGVTLWWKSIFSVAEFTKNTRETIIWKAKRVGVVTMTEKGCHFLTKIEWIPHRVTSTLVTPLHYKPKWCLLKAPVNDVKERETL